MKHSVSFFVFLTFGVCLSSCRYQNSQSSNGASRQDSFEYDGPAARLDVPLRVDMGVFDNTNIKKFVDIPLSNKGTDTLYILAALPDCDCTTVELKDSALAPGQSAFLRAWMDLSEFHIEDTIAKQFVIYSNNFDNNHVRVTLVGERKF